MLAVEILHCFDQMGGMSRQDVADEFAKLLCDPLYLDYWYNALVPDDEF